MGYSPAPNHNGRVPPAPFLISGAICGSALTWAVLLALAPAPLSPDAAAVIAVTLSGSAVSVGAAMLVARARWSRPAAGLLGAACMAPALALPLGPAPLIATALAAAAVAGVVGPWLHGWLRRLPAAEAPPRPAALALIALAVLPAVVAAAGHQGLRRADWALIAVAAGSGLALSRSRVTGLWATRLLLPGAGAFAAVGGPLPAAAVLAAAVLAAVVPAWHPDVARAVRPVVGVGHRIPPELVDPALLRAAGFDDRGRPRQDRR